MMNYSKSSFRTTISLPDLWKCPWGNSDMQNSNLQSKMTNSLNQTGKHKSWTFPQGLLFSPWKASFVWIFMSGQVGVVMEQSGKTNQAIVDTDENVESLKPRFTHSWCNSMQHSSSSGSLPHNGNRIRINSLPIWNCGLLAHILNNPRNIESKSSCVVSLVRSSTLWSRN